MGDVSSDQFAPHLQDLQKGNMQSSHQAMPFNAQFDYLSQQPQNGRTNPQYGDHSFDMSSLNKALPGRSMYDNDNQNVFSPASVYQIQHSAQYGGQQGPPREHGIQHTQPQQFFPPQFQMPRQNGHRAQPQYPRMDGFGFGMSVPQYSPVNAQFGPVGYSTNGAGHDYGQFARRVSEPAPVPSFPRGPPRKPKQSGHALWVGNLPPAANVTDLKDHFSRDATKDIESLFLISKSNCAFVNYRSEQACTAAMNRFHDSRFHGVRLVCRLRRGSTTTLPAANGVDETSSPDPSVDTAATQSGNVPPADPESPVIVGKPQAVNGLGVTEDESEASPFVEATKVPEKYFIIKSLTVQDLEASVRNGTWATQSHNETGLSHAYGAAENVYLIFSANKSGEYFGYARMSSPISGEPVNLGSSAETEESKTSGTPRSIPTPATEFAPKGRIIDDSARGTIFWEADISDVEEDSPVRDGNDVRSGQHWGRQFGIEWVSTARLPFFRTRGLRNPWNANREVKIARDGTELEPSVGRRLVAMFHRPAPTNQGGPVMSPVENAFPHSDMPWSAGPWLGDGMGTGQWQQTTA